MPMTARFIVADVFAGLATLETGSVDLVITSPPFLALRSYLPADHPDKGKEIGSEATPSEFIDVLLRVTEELRRVLAPHGSICVELGDTYAGSGGAGGDYGENGWRQHQEAFGGSGRLAR
jgi:site-specific DNA-methyltransferase (cytosine-N4-specific)